MKRTPLRRCSVKQAKALKEYAVLRKEYLADNPVCELSIGPSPFALLVDKSKAVPSCGGSKSTQIHHIRRRGKYLNDTSTYLALCSECHRFIETHANLARTLGLIQT